MCQFKDIQKMRDGFRAAAMDFIRKHYGLRMSNPSAASLFLLHGGQHFINELGSCPLTELYDICRSLDAIRLETEEQLRAMSGTQAAPAAPKTGSDTATVIYTDGSYYPTRKLGAWAYVFPSDGRKASGLVSETKASNNVAELLAIRNAVRALPDNASAVIRSDSTYAIGVLGDKKAKQNLPLIQSIRDYIRGHRLNVRYEWVKGHNGDEYNNLCDRMCRETVNKETEKQKQTK